MRLPRLNKRGGTTYVEMTLCTLLVGLVLVASLESAGSAARSTIGLNTDLRAQRYAARMMAELMSVSYYDPEAADVDAHFGIEADENSTPSNRLGFDDLDDYDDWAESSALQDRHGAADMNSSGWARTVVITKLQHDNPSNQLSDSDADEGARLITVTVTSPGGDVTVLQGIRGIHGSLQEHLGVDATLVTGVRLQLTTTNVTATERSAINNHASGP